jgi:hypothetical protein
MSRARLLVLTALSATLACVAAQAETPLAPFRVQAKAPAISLAPRPLDLAAPRAALPLRYDRAPAPLPPGVARTSVEHSADDLTGSAGLLCGLQPNADTSGAATARGYDPDGKFVGAKLALRF